MTGALVARAQGNSWDKVRYSGGILQTKVDAKDSDNHLTGTSDKITLQLKDKQTLETPTSSVTGLSYGQEAHRRVGTMVAVGIAVTPIALFGLFHKTRLHLIGIELVLLSFALHTPAGPQAVPQSTPPQETSRKKAWDILWAGAHDSKTDKRANAIHALEVLPANPAVVQLAENALQDKDPDVRAAAAKALGAIGSTESIPGLEKALSDKDISVGLAAARSLLLLKNDSGYDIYYAVLTGERKSGPGLVARQLNELKNPKKAMEFAFDQGIGFLAFGGYGMEALHALKKRNDSPTRAAAAGALATDPDPRSGQALAKAVSDKDWIVRAAALGAIAKRGDPALLKDIEPAMSDKKDIVRCTAAAAVLRLAWTAQGNEDKKEQVCKQGNKSLTKACPSRSSGGTSAKLNRRRVPIEDNRDVSGQA